MGIGDEELDYEYHVARYTGLGLITGDPEKDAHWHCEAKETHAQIVFYATREVYMNAVALGLNVNSAEAQLQLNFGVARRTNFIWLSLQHLLELIPPNRNEPLPNVDVDEVARDLNVIYINIRGTLDNFAWCLVDLFGNEETRKLPPININLFGKDFLKDANLREVAKFVSEFAEWNKELKARRDPAAHRIPLSVPPAVLDEAAQEVHARLSAEYREASNEAVTAVGEGVESSALFEKATLLHDRLQQVGTFVPVFVHHPDMGATEIYPVVPQDIAQLVRIARGLTAIISEKLALGHRK